MTYERRGDAGGANDGPNIEGTTQIVTFETPLASGNSCRMLLNIRAAYRDDEGRRSARERFEFECRIESTSGDARALVVPDIQRLGGDRPWGDFLEQRGIDDEYGYEISQLLEFDTFSGRFLFDPDAAPLVLVPADTNRTDLAFVSAPEKAVPEREDD